MSDDASSIAQVTKIKPNIERDTPESHYTPQHEHDMSLAVLSLTATLEPANEIVSVVPPQTPFRIELSNSIYSKIHALHMTTLGYL